MIIINLDEFNFEGELHTRRVEYNHNESGLEEIKVCECGCKVVCNYSHLDREIPPPHYVGCPAPNCTGAKAQMHGSAYVFSCEDHSGEVEEGH